MHIPQHIILADPEFHKPAEVDALIGVQLFYRLLCVGQIDLQGYGIVLQKTQLGWIIVGDVCEKYSKTKVTTCHLSVNPLNIPSDELTRFWEIEQVPNKSFLSNEEQICETHFPENTKRDNLGRFIVKLPFNENKLKLGNSYEVALRRLYALENKFKKSPPLKEEYSKFLYEYQCLGHMSQIQDSKSISEGYFLPHHAVLKHDSLTTKIRVVFDGSAKSSSGISLNDALMV